MKEVWVFGLKETLMSSSSIKEEHLSVYEEDEVPGLLWGAFLG